MPPRPLRAATVARLPESGTGSRRDELYTIGVEEESHIVDVATGALVPAALAHVRDALEATGDWDFVRDAVDRLVAEGGPAQRQQATFSKHPIIATWSRR